jgi:phenylacetate-CoA ligase
MGMQDILRQIYRDRCLEALDVALNRTPMYASWRRLDPGEGAPLNARYAALPALTKADLRAHFPYGVVPQGLDLDAALARREVSFVKTSGTAEEAVTNVWNQEWWNGSERASWSLNEYAARAMTGSHREAILASALSVGPRSEGTPLPREERALGNYLFLNEYGSTAEWPESHEARMSAELREYAPVAFEASPSLLARLARWSLREGVELFQPRLITLTYEFASALQLRVIRKAFSSPVASSYGSTEAGYVFMECECGRLHQNSSSCRADIVPLEGVEDERVGRILVTTFGNRWFPLLRFEIEDLARISPDPCPCGRSFGLTLSGIEGRLISSFRSMDGRLVTHGQMDRVLEAVEGVEGYRLDQESPNLVRLRLILDGSRPGSSVLRDARTAIRDLLGNRLEVTAEVVERLWPEVSGKYLLAKRHFPLDNGNSGS